MNKRAMAALALAAVAAQALAETLTWVGGATDSGNFAAAANWSPAQAPRPGDTLVVKDAVTFAATTFDVGAAGLTIESSAAVRCNVAFTGSGELSIHSKAGTFYQTGCPDFTGDWRLYDGVVEPTASLGAGTVYVESGASNARLQLGRVRPFANDIHVVGASPAIAFTRSAQLTGRLSSDGPFTILVNYLDRDTSAEIQNLEGGGGGHLSHLTGRPPILRSI